MPATRVRSVERIATRIRLAIMSGDYRPGAVLPQVELARSFGVSRTPLREALRRLEAEGLVEAMRVKVTLPHLTESDLNGLLAATASLRIAFQRDDVEVTATARRALHARYGAKAGELLRSTVATRLDSCERYRRLYDDGPATWNDDYGAIASACIGRHADEASRRIARLEAQYARAVLARIDAGYEPTAIRTALQMLEGSSAPSAGDGSTS